MSALRRVTVAALAVFTLGVSMVLMTSPVGAQDRMRTKEVVVGLGAEPRTMLGVNLLGDWLRDTLDPKLRV